MSAGFFDFFRKLWGWYSTNTELGSPVITDTGDLNFIQELGRPCGFYETSASDCNFIKEITK